MVELNFDGLNSSGIATGEFSKLIGQIRFKDVSLGAFSANRVSSGNKDSIILNIFGDWGLGKSHLAFKLFSEINGLIDSNNREIIADIFSDNAICVLLNYKFIERFKMKFLPRNIALAAAYWLDDDSYSMHIGNKDSICFSAERQKIISELKTTELKKYHNQFENHKDENYNPFEALKIFLNENHQKRLIIIIDEIEELEQSSATGFTRINISNLYDRLVNFTSTASNSIDERYRIGLVFLISQKMYDKVKGYVEQTETSSSRRFTNLYLRRYSSENMFEFLNVRLTNSEIEFIKPYKEYFLAIWEACNRNFGWFEVAAKNLCLELTNGTNITIQVIERALMRTKKNRFSIFNQLAYKSLLNKFQNSNEEVVNEYCLKAGPQDLKPPLNLIDNILVHCGNLKLEIDDKGDIVDTGFAERLKKNKSRIGEMISFENSIGTIPYESIIDSLYKINNNDFLTYFPDIDFQFHLTWAANRKLDMLFTEKLKKSLDIKKSDKYFLLSTENRRDIYPYYKPNISANWINANKLRELKVFLDS